MMDTFGFSLRRSAVAPAPDELPIPVAPRAGRVERID